MGQQANSGRNASLDDKKIRAEGRHGRTGQKAAGRGAIADAGGAVAGKGKIGGAFGRDGKANKRGGTAAWGGGGGGGGGESSPAGANDLNTGASKRSARRRG